MSGSVVVDTSLVIAWVIDEVHSAGARALLLEWERGDVARLAPMLLASEAASAILSCARRGLIDTNAAPVYLSAVLRGITLTPDDHRLAERALMLAAQLGQGRVYDAMYAALAERQGCQLWTGDRRFYNACRLTLPFVHWIGE